MGFFSTIQRRWRVSHKISTTVRWVTQSTHRDQRHFLEKHLDLLSPETVQILKILVTVLNDRPDEFQHLAQVREEHIMKAFKQWRWYLQHIQRDPEIRAEVRRDCEDSIKLLEKIRDSGEQKEAILSAYIDLFGWSVLD